MAGLGHKKKFCFDLIFVSIFFRDYVLFFIILLKLILGFI